MCYASAICSGNAAYVAAQHGGTLPTDPLVLERYFAARTGRCTSSRYLGEGQRDGTMLFVFMLHNGDGDNWWIVTTEGGKVVRVD